MTLCCTFNYQTAIMKKVIRLFILIMNFICFEVKSQYNILVDFSDTAIINKHIFIDTANYPLNQWQIGSAVKNLFNEPYPNKVIVTDTINSYSVNDTSVFIFKVARPYGFGASNISTFLKFNYKLHKDGVERFIVDVAADTGMHWVNMITQDTTYQIVWYGNKPNFEDTVSLAPWKTFHANFSYWFSKYYNQGNFPYYADADTFKFRFTFISDSIQTNKDGCMIDSIRFFFQLGESVEDLNSNANMVQFYPNPLKNQLHIIRKKLPAKEEFLTIYSLDGNIVFNAEISKKSIIPISLNTGIYMLYYKNSLSTKQEKIYIE